MPFLEHDQREKGRKKALTTSVVRRILSSVDVLQQPKQVMVQTIRHNNIRVR